MDLMMIFHLADPLTSLLLLPVFSFIACSIMICGLQWYQFNSVKAMSAELASMEIAGEQK
ncbi:hypothetical protein BCU94_01825 [Shewanella sp. 10N.286.52.C2]|nr:hypothetical protein BCU94_01825 [Shewanella sp. 10N.286.52.C2]PMG41598.1 hypothetical protein BCU91_10115 [Shewanella sp. 10N.286.52.B9]PMH85412.1 hypothetical protein BCU57_14710 [Shewanella sp. 10N.286.48.B5]PMH98039.1 hypothetical protein BCU55_17055 [Shewanella sp. 10N.286.48.A6]